jgi:hypothetical protein
VYEAFLDPRQRTGSGFSPIAKAAQLIFTLTSGGASLADAERLSQDRVLMRLLGSDKSAEQTALGKWLITPALAVLSVDKSLKRLSSSSPSRSPTKAGC